jgi:glycyl-tRNA synthetase beta chain
VAMAVALADKLDSLVGFFAIGEKPTGSGDPFALRRAALGVIRIVRENKLKLGVYSVLRLSEKLRGKDANYTAPFFDALPLVPSELSTFILDRLRITLRDEGFAPDILEAAFAIADDVINRIFARVTALSTFLTTEDGKNLSAGYKRASNILKAEDKKGALPDAFTIDAKALELREEMALNDSLAHVQAQLPDLLKAEDFDGAMTALSTLRAPVDAFFEAVLVNDADPAKRLNRLALLAALRDATLQVADFEKIAG